MRWLLILSLAVAALSAHGDYISFYWENDLLNQSDRNTDKWYTNGGRLTYGLDETRTIFGGQNMYTPSHIDEAITEAPVDDRPYGGWLYIGYGQWWHQPFGFTLGRGYTEVMVGPVGAYSFAEETQKCVHDIFGNREPLGWDTQLDDGFGAQTYSKYQINAKVLYPWLGADAHVGASVGNIKLGAEVGFTLKAGGGLANSLAFDRITIKEVEPARFVYLSVIPQYVGYDRFVPSYLNPEEFVMDYVAGVTWGFKSGLDITYQWTYRSRQFEAQPAAAEFGAVGLRYRF
jgi:lipid A 3-O-deacylase